MATNNFNTVESISPPRSRHVLKHTNCFDTNFGWVIPVAWRELVPGDSTKISLSALIKGLTMPAVPMGKVSAYFNMFFVPTALIDDDWEKRLIGIDPDKARRGQNAEVPYTTDFPSLLTYNGGNNTLNEIKKYQLRDYLGLPLGEYNNDLSDYTVNPMLAYWRIWNDYFRPEDYKDTVPDTLQEFNLWTNSTSSYEEDVSIGDYLGYRSLILRCCLNNDVFNTALLNRQLGNPANVPLQGILSGYSKGIGIQDSDGNPLYIRSSATTYTPAELALGCVNNVNSVLSLTSMDKDKSYGASKFIVDSSTGNVKSRYDDDFFYEDGTPFTFAGGAVTGHGEVSFNANLSGASLEGASFSISDFRLANTLQKWSEINNKCGTRLGEYIRAMFSVNTPDERLHRSEWIGGFEMPIMTDVFHQDSETATRKLGDDVGKMLTMGSDYLGSYFAREYGYIMVTMHIKPEVVYHQGIDKMWIKPTRYDYYNPLFNGLSEEGIRNDEVCHVSGSDRDSKIFGYQRRNYHMESVQDKICGGFHDVYGNMTWNRTFTATDADAPNLDIGFKLCVESDYADKFNVVDEPPFLCQINIIEDMVRPMPTVCTPSL